MEADYKKFEDPDTVTCEGMPQAKELEAFVRRQRESCALWVWGDVYYENELLMREIIEQAEEEVFLAWGL